MIVEQRAEGGAQFAVVELLSLPVREHPAHG